MPIYEYRCTNGHTFEVFQSMTDDPVSTCEVCGEAVERLFSPVAVHYKGSGFYTTDYARKGSATASGDGGGKPESSSGSSETKPSEAASKAESSSKSSGSSGSGSSD